MRRHAYLVLLLLVAMCLAFVLAVLWPNPPKVVPDQTPADYNTHGAWPGTDPLVCLQDETQGFPVEQALRDFHDLPVRFVIAEDCSDHDNVIRVRTIINEKSSNSGWFRSERDGQGFYESATIWLNVAQAYRLDPHGWRMVLVHELGHAAGLEHTYEADSVMHPQSYADRGGLTATDREQIEKLYGARS